MSARGAIAWAAYATLAVAGWVALPAGGFWINDEGVKHLQAMAISSSPDGSSELRLDFTPEETGGLLPHSPVYLWRRDRAIDSFIPTTLPASPPWLVEWPATPACA